MNSDGQQVVVPAAAQVKFPTQVLHDVRDLGAERCVIMFIKVNPKVLRGVQQEGRDGSCRAL